MEACQNYVNNSKAFGSPWEFQVFIDLEKAMEWAKGG